MRGQAFLLAIAGAAGIAAIAPGCATEETVDEDGPGGGRGGGGEGEGEGESESEPLPPGRCRRDHHCDDPPTPCHVSPGICKGGGCSYQIGEGMPCEDPDACVFGGTCRAGQCLGPSCEEDVAPAECVSDTTLRVYRGPGRCTPDGCEYDFDERECPRGCDAEARRCTFTDCLSPAECPATCADPAPADLGGSFAGSTAGRANALTPGCGFSEAPETVWELVPAAGASVCVDTQGSDFDTVLSVMTGCPGAEIACNDDTFGLQSQVSFSAVAGTSYFIVVDGYADDSGTFRLNIREGACAGF